MAGGRRTAGAVALAMTGALLWVLPGAAPAEAAVSTAKVVIGHSVDGRPIVAYHRWRVGQWTKKVLVIGNLHGNEKAGLRVVRQLRTRTLPVNLNLWLIPSANPDGTAADRRTNAHGVDLNRNFPRRWVYAGAGTSNYSGPSAASEPETRALLRFVKDKHPRTTIVFHQPLHGVDSYRAKSMSLVRALADAMNLPIKSFDCDGGCHGTFTDWHNDRTPGRAVTVEFGASPTDARISHVAWAVLRVGSTS
ncbi:MAG: murein peptide amidase [Actinomycetota bacterium]|nr:murein peptide amidase [Actinomycetota bacterium]